MAFNLVESALTNLRLLYQNERDMMIFVDQEMKKLESNLSAILSLLHDAEEKQLRGTSWGIDDWLQKLEDAVLLLEDIVDDCLTEAKRDKYEGDRSCSFLSFLHPDKIMFRHNISGRMKDIREQLDLISQEKSQFNLLPFLADATAERHGSANIHHNIPSRRSTASAITESSICGREEDKEKIVSQLLDYGSNSENLTVHTIWGMGGLGKTTLAQLVYNDEKVKDHFELKIWICVSDNFELETLIKAIIGSPQSLDHLDSLQNQLQGKLRGKRYLLVLDDVWNDDRGKWEHLRCLLSCGSKGSAVLVTTRQLKIATIMRTPPVEPYRLAALSDEDCWQVLKNRAFGLSVVEETETLLAIGKDIATKCGGVPLAAKALGGLLSFTSDERRWLHVRDSDLWNLSNSDDSIMSALKLSYLNLPTRYRRCFSYCSLFPKDYWIEKEEIIHLWIANGLIPSEGTMSTAVEVDDTGDEIIHELHWRSLIDKIWIDKFGDIKAFKMHDLVHDLAHLMMGNVVSNLTSSELLHPRIQHIFATRRSESLKNVKGLRTYMYKFYPGELASYSIEHTSLRALCLQYLKNVTELLPRICFLKHLRYLNLSFCEMEELPESICSLWNLQILILDKCGRLKILPNGMGRLKSLRYLSMRDCSELWNMPISIGSLTSLRTLSLVIVGESERIGFQLSALSHFKYLRGEMEIRNLERVTEVEHAQEVNLREKHDIDRLTLSWMEGLGGDANRNRDPQHEMLILKVLRPSPKLKSLKVMGYGGARFPTWMMDEIASFRYIQSVILNDCRICPQLPPLWRLPCLKILVLRNLDSVRYLIEVEGEAYENEGTCGVSFSSLETLWLEYLGSLEAVIMLTDDTNVLLFPRLSHFRIKGCPRLMSPSTILGAAPSLLNLETDNIDLLPTSNPRNVQIHNSLEELIIANSDSLEFFPANQMLRGMSSIVELFFCGCRNLKYLDEVYKSDALAQSDTPRFPVLQLQRFYINACENLECLPDWLGGAMSLNYISITNCPKLSSIPNCFRRLTKLKFLFIDGCPELKRRCRKDIGEDWDNIAHVPNICIF